MDTFLNLLGTAGNLLFQWAGLSKSEEQQAKALQYQDRTSRRRERREDQRFATQSKFAEKQFKAAEKERARTWKWKEEEQSYTRGQNAVNRFMGLLAADPVAKDRLMMTWNSARTK